MINPLPFPNLLEELLDYGKMKQAEMLYYKCLRKSKFELAQKLKRKYHFDPYKYDRIWAFQNMIYYGI